jgi:GR25 family glycosyltransferase involved in LPS biosynthesis
MYNEDQLLHNSKLGCNIYVCHYTPLVNRKQSFIQQAEKLNIHENIFFIESDDRENMNPNRSKLFCTGKLKPCEVSLFLKHLSGMEMIINGDCPYGIIMEDDSIFKDNFLDYLKEYMCNLPIDFDIIYPGYFPFLSYYKQYTGKEHPIVNTNKVNQYFYDMTNKNVFPWTGNNKGTDFYIISKKCCKLILDECFNRTSSNEISKPIDHYIGTILFNKKSKVYWTNTDIVIHGSLTVFSNSMKGR